MCKLYNLQDTFLNNQVKDVHHEEAWNRYISTAKFHFVELLYLLANHSLGFTDN